MKALHIISNSEKGRLLADLFPEQTADIIEYILESCQYLSDHKIQIADEWKNGFITFDFWYRLAVETEKTISKHRYSLQRSSKVFSDQLFYGHAAMFTIDCILNYAENKKDHPKFQKMVSALFG